MRAPEGSPAEIRRAIRQGQWTGPTATLAPGYVQANLVILPRKYADDFRIFCERNPKPCPLLESTAPGSWEPRRSAPGADLRSDLPRYNIYRKGELREEASDITPYWSDDFVAFLLGCSFTFDALLQQNGIPVRHVIDEQNVPMYRTNIACRPGGVFHGPMVVSMRPLTPQDTIRARSITSLYRSVHGDPIHAGRPEEIGIADISRPDFGQSVAIKDGEQPVFWACGVTSQLVVQNAKPDLAITHAPGHMFITDVRIEELAAFEKQLG